MKKIKEKVAASLTVYGIADMTPKGRRAICAWLCNLAADIQAEPKAFNKTFRARYMYAAKLMLVTCLYFALGCPVRADLTSPRVVNALDYGPPTYATLSNVLYRIGTDETILGISGGDWDLTQRITIPSNIALFVDAGSSLNFNHGDGVTSCVNARMVSGPWEIFTGGVDPQVACTGSATMVYRWEQWGSTNRYRIGDGRVTSQNFGWQTDWSTNVTNSCLIHWPNLDTNTLDDTTLSQVTSVFNTVWGNSITGIPEMKIALVLTNNQAMVSGTATNYLGMYRIHWGTNTHLFPAYDAGTELRFVPDAGKNYKLHFQSMLDGLGDTTDDMDYWWKIYKNGTDLQAFQWQGNQDRGGVASATFALVVTNAAAGDYWWFQSKVDNAAAVISNHLTQIWVEEVR